jgi:arylsulfatase A-like enzyme
MDVLLVQWTSLVVPPTTLAVDFVVTAVVLTAVVGPIVALVASVRRPVPGRILSTAVLVALFFYDVSRIRTEKLSWHDPVVLALTGILGFGCWIELRRTSERSERADLVGAVVLVSATAVAWAALWIRGRFTPTIVVLGLLSLATALQLAWNRWRVGSGGAEATGSIAAPLWPGVLMVALAVSTYPVAPGFLRPLDVGDAGAAPASSRELPNVIVVVMDTVRADHLSVYGYERATSPELARFAERAYLFHRATANSNWSLPSHATLLTGLLPHQHGARAVVSAVTAAEHSQQAMARLAYQPLADEQVTLAERLREVGYQTALVSANYAWLSPESGLLQGFDYVDSRPGMMVGWEPFAAPYLRHQPIKVLATMYARGTSSKASAREIVDHVENYLTRRSRHPFFLLINFMDAHAPYTSALHADTVPEIRARFASHPLSAANLESYDRSIAFLDQQLGRLFADLQARGLFDDALIVVTSDHGERFGSIGRGRHGDDLSQESVHVPLLIKVPHQARGERSERRAQLADVAPTILDRAGLPIPQEFFGSALAERSRAVIAESYLAAGGTVTPLRPVPIAQLDSELPTMWALFEADWKLVHDARGRDALYDLASDPAEATDLASSQPEVTKRMAERLAALLPAHTFTDYRVPVAQAEASSATVEKLKSLGYAQ